MYFPIYTKIDFNHRKNKKNQKLLYPVGFQYRDGAGNFKSMAGRNLRVCLQLLSGGEHTPSPLCLVNYASEGKTASSTAVQAVSEAPGQGWHQVSSKTRR